MSQFTAGPAPGGGPHVVPPETDVYSVLLIIATVLLAMGTIFVAVRTYQLFGSLLP